ncbi:MAG: replication-associated recombination protein A [Solirubrobacterales bacterium]
MDRLFETSQASGAARARTTVPLAEEPLAARMRPATLDEFVGQQHLLAAGSALRTAIEQGAPHSMILYGPPGTGKTTLARIVAAHAGAAFEEESAVNAGRAEVRAVIERAEERVKVAQQSSRFSADEQQSSRLSARGKTVLFLDEIHRFNKGQQDTLLPAVEEGLLTLIGATTENPYFEVNSALLSRARIYELQPLDVQQVEQLLRRALADAERGVPDPPEVPDDVIEFFAVRSSGDARTAYNALELACETAQRLDRPVTVELAEDALQQKALLYDKGGDRHYDYASAWIKATRGSDVDASLYYLAVMLEGGEDPRFIARRMVILASEDIGNADPRALQVAVAAAQAVEHVGLPECALNLSQAAVYLALAPKSNASYLAISRARGDVREHGTLDPPGYLRDAHYAGAKELGRGIGYEYPHDLPEGVSNQSLMPEELSGRRYYEPTDRGFERELRERLKRRRSSEPE